MNARTPWLLTVVAAVAVSVAVALGAWRSSPAARAAVDVASAGDAAEQRIIRAEELILEARRAEGIESEAADGNARSSLIGAELTVLTTTIGTLEAKRIATSPRWGRALAVRLREAGLRRGDVVAAGFSGSFPGLNLAVVAACESLGLDLLAISSVTASSWGANQPGFTWPEIEARLVRAGTMSRSSVALTLGGAGDSALDLEPEGRAMAERIAGAVGALLGIPVLRPASFDAAIAARFGAYAQAARGRRICLYVNVGGTEPSLGRSAAVLRLRNGFLPGVPFDFSPTRGLIARFAERGVRVLTLLNVRDLASRWGVL